MEHRKQCARCHIEKAIEDFHLITRKSQKRRYECRECSKERNYAWRIKNKEHLDGYRRRYMKKFKEIHPLVYKCSYIHRRFGSVGIAALEDLYYKHPYCEYCGKSLSMKEVSIDHALPISRGGSPDNLANLVVCCYPCNQLKGTKNESEFKAFLLDYAKRLAGKYLAEPGMEGVTVRGEIIPTSPPAPDLGVRYDLNSIAI